MRYGIFSDIHSNLEAFQAVISAYKGEDIDKYLCAGDIVGYGANPHECIEQTKQLTEIIVAGNHDWAATGKFDTSYFNPIAKQAIEWTAQQLSPEEKNFLNNLVLVFENQDLCLVHGTLDNPVRFDYILDLYTARMNFSLLKRNILFIGHSHYPGIFIKKDADVTYMQDDCVALNKKYKYIVNVGSIGQPRDGDNRASLCVYDTKKDFLELRRIEYDIKTAQNKILKNGLAEFLATRLAQGK